MVATINYQKIILLALVLLTSLIVFSEYSKAKDLCQVSIIVKDSITFDPIPGAKIFIGPSGTYIGYTNESGIISFKAEATHEYTFIVEKSGYYTENTIIKCWPDDSRVVYVYLEPVSDTQQDFHYHYYYEYQTQTAQTSDQNFYAYFAQNYIEIPANSEKAVDLYVCSNNNFFGFVTLTAVHSNGISVDAPFLINLPKNSCVVEKVRIHSGDSYGYHYLYVYVKQRDNIVFSNRLTIYIPQKEESISEKSIIPILNATENVVEKGEPLLVEAKIIAKGVSENTYITAKIRVDDKIIKREYFKIDKDSTITLNEIINTNYFEEGYHYIILEVSTRDIINSTSKLVKFVVYENKDVDENEVYANSEETASNDYHCLEIVDLRNYKVRMNETNKINFILYNCGSITENNIKIVTLFNGRTLINTVDEIKPNEYKAVTIHIAVHEPFDEYTARIHVYNQNVSIDAGFKLIGVVPDVKLVVRDAYTANECSDTIIPVKIINAGDEPEKVTLYVDSPINYTMDETTFTINKKSTLTVPITFHIPCNSTKSEYIVKFMTGKNSYYTTINTKSKNVNDVETLIWFILVALIAIAVIAVVKRIEIGQMRCWKKNKDELMI